MKLRHINPFAALLLVLISAAAPLARADIILYSSSVPLDTDALRFSDSSLAHSGSLVQGNFLGAGLGYVMNFTSSSGNGQIVGLESAGVPTQVEGLAGNNPLAALSFSLSQPNQSFTRANFVVSGGTSIIITVLEPDGTITAGNFGIGGFSSFSVEAINGQSIQSISLTQTSINDIRGMRFGGFASAVGSSVPDSGTTLPMLGFALAGLVALRRRLHASKIA